jgi:hypothetical protein
MFFNSNDYMQTQKNILTSLQLLKWKTKLYFIGLCCYYWITKFDVISISFPIKKNYSYRKFCYIISENYFIRNLKWNVMRRQEIYMKYNNIDCRTWRYYTPRQIVVKKLSLWIDMYPSQLCVIYIVFYYVVIKTWVKLTFMSPDIHTYLILPALIIN